MRTQKTHVYVSRRMDDDPMEYPRRQQKKLTIFDAASQGNIEEAAKILQENPAIINSLTPTGQSLLHIAASKNQELFMSFLLDQGLSVNCVDRKGSTSLHGAAGASIHIHDARGWTPLRYAIVSGSERAV